MPDEASLATYRTLVELHNTTYREMFQLVIVSTLLPVVTLVAGYLSGVQKAE